VFAQALSRQRRHSLDDDVKLFFTIGGDAWIRALYEEGHRARAE
jgi:hypothetical protein